MPARRYSKKNMPSKASRMYGTVPYRARRRSAYRSMNSRVQTVNRQPGGIHTFTKTQFSEDFIASAFLGATSGQFTFALSNLAKATELRGLYDQYRINWVKVDIIPKTNVYSAVNGTTGAISVSAPEAGLFGTAIDYDGGLTSPSMQTLADYSTFKWTRGTNVHSRIFKPKPAITVGGVNAGVAPGDMWIDCGSPSVLHYGLGFCVEDSEQVTLKYDVCIKYNISFRSVR